MKSPSLLEDLIEAFRVLPGVGRKSAQRMAYYLLESDRGGGQYLASQLELAMTQINHCTQCRDFTEQTVCRLCLNPRRDESLLCIVESPADVAAIEQSGAFAGNYFVLMGHLSPLDGIGPDELGFDQLKQRLEKKTVKEVILATSSTVEGEATAHFLRDLILGYRISVTRIAQGVPIGGELEYLDVNTLARSISERRKLEN